MKTNGLSNDYKSILKCYNKILFFLGSTVIKIESKAIGMKTTYINHNIIYFIMLKKILIMPRKSNRIFHSNNVQIRT
jgi:hypothetical protein